MKTDIINLLNSTQNYFFKCQIYDDHYIETVLKNIEYYGVISFDIFDTILTRLVEYPIDIFAIVEKYLIETGFSCDVFAVVRFES